MIDYNGVLMENTIPQILSELEIYAEKNNVPIIRGPERELLLKAAALAGPDGPQRILEIGTAIGYSALMMAEKFPKAEIDTLEIDETRHTMAETVMRRAGVSERVRCHLGDAADVLKTLKGPYDFLYLDGPKGQYLRELKEIEPKLSKNAVIAADNVLFRGLVKSNGPVPHRYRTLVMRLRDYISYVEEKYDTHIYEEGDGLSVSVPKGMT